MCYFSEKEFYMCIIERSGHFNALKYLSFILHLEVTKKLTLKPILFVSELSQNNLWQPRNNIKLVKTALSRSSRKVSCDLWCNLHSKSLHNLERCTISLTEVRKVMLQDHIFIIRLSLSMMQVLCSRNLVKVKEMWINFQDHVSPCSI